MRGFFYPDSVAVIGVSPRPGNLGKNIVANLGTFGFKGPVYFVSPRGGQWREQKIYPDVRELPETPELAVILTPAATVPGLVAACGEKGIKRVVVESGGFSELEAGRGELEAGIKAAVTEHGMRLIGPNCIGVVCTQSGLAVPFPMIPRASKPGGLSIVAQSGGVGLTYLHSFAMSRIGLAKFASVGNKLNVNEEDLLAYLVEDPQTEVILLYLESIVAGRRLLEIIAQSPKPVVVHKSNIAPTSHKIAQSHTAALANDDAVVDAALEQAGAIRAHTVSECIATVKGLTLPAMKGKRVAVISRSGGHAVVAADAAHRQGMELPAFPADYLGQIQEHTRASVIKLQNPLDLGDLFDFHFNVEVLKGALALADIDGVLIVHGYRGPEVPSSRDYIAEAGRLCRDSGKPVSLVVLTDSEELAWLGQNAELPIHLAPEEAMTALKAAFLAGRKEPAPPPSPSEGVDLARAAQVLMFAQDEPGPTELELPEALHLARAAGLEVAPFVTVLEPDEAAAAAREVGFPAALKAVGVSHKTEAGGVALNLAGESAVASEAETMLSKLGPRRLVVMRQLPPGQEVIVGAKQDPAFGALVLCGLGGVMTELIKDVSLRVAPVDEDQAREMLLALQGAPLITGFRGSVPVDLDALARAVARVAALAHAFPAITELDLNPLIAGPNGVVAVDARAVVDPARLPDRAD